VVKADVRQYLPPIANKLGVFVPRETRLNNLPLALHRPVEVAGESGHSFNVYKGEISVSPFLESRTGEALKSY